MEGRTDIKPRQVDVVIVGAGPAGIFAALKISEESELDVLLLEKGSNLSDRHCVARETGRCIDCRPCDITSGWGGAGAYSDGKLTLSPDIGGWLSEYVSGGRLRGLIQDVDGLYRRFGATEEIHGDDLERVDYWANLALKEGMRLLHSPIRHMGTDRCSGVLQGMREELEERVEILTETPVSHILVEEEEDGSRRAAGVVTEQGQEFRSPVVVLAPGREGSSWLQKEAERIGLPVTANAVDIGVRVEVPAVVTDEITDDLYEPKLIYNSPHFEDQVRTFCMNPHGVVSKESYGDVVTVNGHSYADYGRRTPYTNFALLVSTRFTEPFKEPVVYGKSIARLANVLGEDIIVQRLGDLHRGRRSTPERLARGTVEPTLREVTPGDLSFVLPYRHLQDIMDMLEAMDRLLPGLGGRDTLLYGIEVKFYSSRLDLDVDLTTGVEGLYAVGDGAGVTRGLIQASVSGMLAGEAVLSRS